MEDFNNFITKLKWQIATKEFTDMQEFTTDCFVYFFNPPLNADQLDAFLDFIGDSEKLHHITPVDFCNYFLRQHISFDFQFQFVGKLGLRQNIRCWKIVRKIRKELKRVKERNVERSTS